MHVCESTRDTIDDVGELRQSAQLAYATRGSVLPTSPGGADSMKAATVASLDVMVADVLSN